MYEQGLSFNLVFDGDTLLQKVDLILIEKETNLLQDIEITDLHTSSVSETWQTINGKNKSVLNEFNLYYFKLKNEAGKKFNLEVRLYDTGFAYRFVFAEGVGTMKESSSIQFGFDL